MLLYVVQDKKTGNYLSNMSFQMLDRDQRKWMYISYTGKCTGMECCTYRDNAQEILNNLQKYNLESCANKEMMISEVDEDKIFLGNRIIKYI